MSFLRLITILQKEIHQLRRDPSLLGLFISTPLIQLIFFGYAVSTDLKGVRLGVVVEEPAPQVRRLIDEIQNTKAFEITRRSASPGDAQRWLQAGDVDVVVDIPRGFTSAIDHGEAPVVQILSDGTDTNQATLAFQYLSGAARTWAGQERQEHLRAHPEAAIRFIQSPRIDLETRYWYNPDLRSVNFQIPGVLAVILLAIVLSQGSLAVVKEREIGNLEQLAVTPLRGAELLVGKSILYVTLGLIMTGMVTVAARLWFQVPVRGSFLCLLVCVVLYLMCVLGIGLLVSVISRTQVQAQLTATILISPLLLLSGFLFPIANMPTWAQWVSYAMPTRYVMEVMRGIFLKGQGFVELWPQAAALGAFGVLFYLLGILSFKKRVD
jgi:ABC-2 type transport system permease protein